MTLVQTAEWLIVPVLVVSVIIFNVTREMKSRSRARQAWQSVASEMGGSLTTNGRRLEMQFPVGTQTLTVDTDTVTTGGDGETGGGNIEHYTRFRIPCIPEVPLHFTLIERTPGQTVSRAVSRRIDKRPNRGNDLPEILLGDPAFDRVFRLRADPAETAQELLTPLARELSALRYVIWQYNSVPQTGVVEAALTRDVKQISRRSASTEEPPEPKWLLWATVRGHMTHPDELAEIVTMMTALYEAMRKLGIVVDLLSSKKAG